MEDHASHSVVVVEVGMEMLMERLEVTQSALPGGFMSAGAEQGVGTR